MTEITEKDITIIIPVHVWNENVKEMLDNAIQTCPKGCGLIIVTPNGSGVELTNDVAKSFSSFAMVFNEDGSSFQELVNKGVENVKTDWFSILEFDDELSPIWFKNFQTYQKYNGQYKFFLFLVDLYNLEGGKDEFIGNGNEAAWANSFSDTLGVIDEQAVTDFFDFYLTGGIFNTEAWNTIGGLKKSIKLTFWYEWIMRATHKGENLYVIPKVGYAHVLGRDGSLMMNYRQTIDKEESEFWYKTAKTESYFKEDRNSIYVPKETKENDTQV